ncbi:hypothetical protein SLE2022_166770 [Rubroshorea leprosula]
MKAGKHDISILFLYVTALWIGIASGLCNARGLKVNFYHNSCPQAEKIVKDITESRVRSNPVLPAKLIRMHYHDCFVRGCEASILLDTVNDTKSSEKETVPNQTLSGYEVIDNIKAKIEQVCPGVVSCADILALAAHDSVSFAFNRPLWEVPTGRRDGRISLATEVLDNLPSPFSTFDSLLQMFNNKGLDLKDLVLLSGAHTLGVGHCSAFSRRLYNFTGNGDQDPSLDPAYAEFLKKQCPNPANPATTVEMDPQSSLSFDKHYYQTVLENKGLFQSDAALLTNRDSAKIVRRFQISNSFIAYFGNSMKKMGAMGILTGDAGEMRKQCRFINP